MGYPQARWMVTISWTIHQWMRTDGNPHDSGNPHVIITIEHCSLQLAAAKVVNFSPRKLRD